MRYTTIKEHHLFAKSFQKGHRFIGRYVSVFILKDYAAERLKNANPQKKYYNRFGVSVGKKCGGAVQRTRLKRILRAAYRSMESELKTGYLVVLTPRDGAIDVKSTDIAVDLRRAFTKLDFFKSKDV